MTNDNQDALPTNERIYKLLRENEALRESVKKANEQAEHFEREWYLRGDQIEAKDALLRQAVEALGGVHAGEHQGGVVEAIVAIRQHLEGRA